MSFRVEDPGMAKDVTRAHYDRLAASYDQNWAYSPEFTAWMSDRIQDRLKITAGDVAAETAPNAVAAETAVGSLPGLTTHGRNRGHGDTAGAGLQIDHAALGAILCCASVATAASGTAACETVAAIAP